MKIVGLSGSHSRPSKSHTVVELVAARAAERMGGKARCFDMIDAGPELGRTFSRASARIEHEEMWQAVLDCDLLVVGGPVYKGSYTGLFKHFFDLFDPASLRGKPVVLLATGGNDRHALIVEHQLRPLFGFFEALTLPTGVYATDKDFADGVLRAEPILKRVEQVVGEVGLVLTNRPAANIAAG